jgi:hypothetical protein
MRLPLLQGDDSVIWQSEIKSSKNATPALSLTVLEAIKALINLSLCQDATAHLSLSKPSPVGGLLYRWSHLSGLSQLNLRRVLGFALLNANLREGVCRSGLA